MTDTDFRVPVEPAPPPLRRPDLMSDDEQAIAVETVLAAEFAAGSAERDRDRILPWRELERFSETGLWGITVPREFGSAGVSTHTLAQVIAIIGAADGSLSQIPQNHFYALEVLRVGASAKQQRFFFERVLAGIGQRDFKRRTRLFREQRKWVVHGQKFYCTGAIYAHWIPALVADEDSKDVTYLAFIPRNAPGVTVADNWDGFGQRVTGSG